MSHPVLPQTPIRSFQQPRQPDHLFLWPIATSLGFVTACFLLANIPSRYTLLVGFALMPLLLIGAFILFAAACIAIADRRFCRGVCLALALLLPLALHAQVYRAAQIGHLALMRAFGIGIGREFGDDHGLTVNDWSVGFTGGPMTLLVRDPTDGITHPLSDDVHKRASPVSLHDWCAGHAVPLVGHFYLCTLP